MIVPNRAEHPNRKMGSYDTSMYHMIVPTSYDKPKNYYKSQEGSHMRRHVNAQLNLTSVRAGEKQRFVYVPTKEN